MADFQEAKQGYREARGEVEGVRAKLIAARERVRALAGEERRLGRGAGAEPVDARLAELAEQRLEAQAAAVHLGDMFDQAQATIRHATTEFAGFTDPVEAVGLLPDNVPIALFPLRIETRYKTVDDGSGAARHLLQVRAYPDDILVDTFQPEISQAELDNTTIYWTHRWRADGDQARHRAAWTALAKAHGAGRAKWLTDHHAPLNLADEPRAGPGRHILVIRPAAPVPDPEKPAIATFWERVWATAGVERDAAFADLVTALGEARAKAVEAELAPANLGDPDVKPNGSLTLHIAFLDLPDPPALPVSQEDWTRGARTWLLPERLVLLGYQAGKQVLRMTGAPIPAELQVGPDPSAPEDEQLRADGADLTIPEAMRWTVDFDEAVANGMGFLVDLTESELDPAFERLFVLGIRVGSDAAEGALECEQLIRHHQASRKGFSLLPQGRATNNTDQAGAGYSWWESHDEAFAHFHPAVPHDDPPAWDQRRDGAWLAGLLGLDPKVLRDSPYYYGTDQAEARAVNVALWPATLGYYMEQMLEPVFSEDDVRATRDFFGRFVIGRGTLPLVRIGRQPYGVLPATVWSKAAWWQDRRYAGVARAGGLPDPSYLGRLHALSERAATLWRGIAAGVSHVGNPGPDPQKTLLHIIGLHPTSAEFYQRYSQSFTQYYNLLSFEPFLLFDPVIDAARRYVEAGLRALADLGWPISPGAELPELLEKIFLKKANPLDGDLVATVLSETAPLPVDRADGRNYIAWLQHAARSSHDMLRRQEGFTGGIPTALLYLMLRHALDLGFVEGGLELRRNALSLSDAAFRAQRKEPKMMSVVSLASSDSQWDALYRPEPAVTGSAEQRLGDFLPSVLAARSLYLDRQLKALDVLKDASTARLERAFVEHLDCLSYRFDAWRLGLQAVQLSFMREETAAGFAGKGLYVGAYGWVEHLEPRPGALEAATLDAEQQAVFDAPGAEPLSRDTANYGHIHAPSPDHAVTAAILRNGHLANATPGQPDLLAVDLGSERVRLAQEVIEGMRNGQTLGALLGYRLERALHDEPGLFLDRLIYDLRRHFPLVGNRNWRTRVSALPRITQVEARNVIDGVAFAEHVAETGSTTYPYGLSGLRPLSDFTGPDLPGAAEIGALIDGHVATMRSIGDAVADLGVAEGVFQVVRGNFDRAAGSLDAFSKGTYPPETEVVATPRSGRTLTHRMGLHLAGGVLPTAAGLANPRAKGEPALAQWLAARLPDPAEVFASIVWQNSSGADVSLTPSMADLGLEAADLFYSIDSGGAREMAGFDDLLIDFAERNGAPAPRHDAVFSLEYKPEGTAGITLFELAPLVRSLRGLVMGARPLRPTDLSLQNEASKSEDAGIVLRADKAQAVRALLHATRGPVATFLAELEGALEGVDPEAARDAARDTIDQWIEDYAALVRAVTPFGLQAASLTAAVESRRRPFTMMLDALGEIIARWARKSDEFDAVMAAYAALPGGAPEAEAQALLIRAGRTISSTVIDPLPPIAGLELDVAALKASFDTERGNLVDLRDDATRTGALLAAITAFLPTIRQIDLTPFDIGPFRDAVLALAQDLAAKAGFLAEDLDRRISEADAALAAAAATVGDAAQAKLVEAAQAMLGKSFILLPEFRLDSARLAEWSNAWADRGSLTDHLETGAEATPFPFDDWLHGLARVRERPRDLELAGLLGAALGTGEIALEALQFPHRPHDVWLAMRFPATFRDGSPFAIEGDKLLYTAHFGPAAEIDPADAGHTYSGLMLDEWVEVIPGTQERTGLAFHYDRPNTEAPQAILLVTPPTPKGAWDWQDIVGAMHESLDFVRIRAVEPAQIDRTDLGPLLPAIISAVTLFPVTAMLNFAFNNNVHVAMAEADE